jgi:hypothetical protein
MELVECVLSLSSPIFTKLIVSKVSDLFITKISANQIKTYLMNTHEETHSGYTVDIVQIFKMSRHGETERFQKVRIFLIYLHNLKEQNVVSNDNFSKLSCSLLVQEIGCFCGMVLG